MIRKFTIWDSQFDIEDYADFIHEEEDEYGPLTDYEKYDRVNELNQGYLDDERVNLDIKLKNPILVIGDLGLWNGRRSGYKIVESGNIKDILNYTYDKAKWYCDGYNIRGVEVHHDGTNYYLYREIKNMDNMGNFLDMIYHGKKYSRSVLNYYTRSIALDVGRIYGIAS